ncbi:hypothetical protein INR49_007164 [Caranx melampygus]|nr:hypothetical protein INR49_007164 [Caranx melampygus]
MSLLQSSKKKDKRILSGTCPDPKCQARLFFPAHGSVSIECTECGQRHEQKNLLNVEEVTDPDVKRPARRHRGPEERDRAGEGTAWITNRQSQAAEGNEPR